MLKTDDRCGFHRFLSDGCRRGTNSLEVLGQEQDISNSRDGANHLARPIDPIFQLTARSDLQLMPSPRLAQLRNRGDCQTRVIRLMRAVGIESRSKCPQAKIVRFAAFLESAWQLWQLKFEESDRARRSKVEKPSEQGTLAKR